MNWFWHALWICLVVIPVTLLWAGAILHIVLFRKDLPWWRRLIWLLVVILLPLIGALIYAGVSVGHRGATAYGSLDTFREQGALTEAQYQRQIQRDYRMD